MSLMGLEPMARDLEKLGKELRMEPGAIYEETVSTVKQSLRTHKRFATDYEDLILDLSYADTIYGHAPPARPALSS